MAAGLHQAYGLSSYAGPFFDRAVASADRQSITLTFNNTGAHGLALSAMNVSAVHRQTNWSGLTPFEVCTAPGGSRAPRMYCLGPGAFTAGGDLMVSNMTLAAASAWCAANASCIGMTAKTTSGCGTDGVMTVYFKSAVTGSNPDPSWVHYSKSAPCTLMSRFDGWSQPKTTTVGSDGQSVVLGGLPDGGRSVVAVRFAWRSYPCEHRQCGLYAAAEGLPPPPFYASLEVNASRLH